MSQRVIAKILSNREVAPGVFEIFLDAPSVVERAESGQFIHLRVSSSLSYDPFLRRPLSIFSLDRDKGYLGLLFRVLGRGTTILAAMRDGDTLDIMGPLGRGFNLKGNFKRIAVVGGGIGVAPLLSLAQGAWKRGVQVHTCIGALNASMVLCIDDFKACSKSMKIMTDDGSMGGKGLVTDALKELLEGEEIHGIFACGPEPMLKAVAQMAMVSKVPCQVSLEARMACGVGACLGCTIKTKRDGRYLKVCADGPVFDSEEVDWDE